MPERRRTFDCPHCGDTVYVRFACVQTDGSLWCADCDTQPIRSRGRRWCRVCGLGKDTAEMVEKDRYRNRTICRECDAAQPKPTTTF